MLPGNPRKAIKEIKLEGILDREELQAHHSQIKQTSFI
jgi:hypothetical protein